MEQTPQHLSAEAIEAWYRYASAQPGFVGSLLQVLRERQGLTVLEQEEQFGIDDQAFLRLQGMPLPRPERFAADALRIAQACGLGNPVALVRALALARDLERSVMQSDVTPYYQAAFDAVGELDLLPEEE